jgi:tripartite-type tricarboxylate transporter receptor subunit TctC
MRTGPDEQGDDMKTSESIFRRTCVGILAGLTVAAAASGAWAAEAFAPKSITITIPSGAGDGTDGAARVTGRFLAKYLPGQPSVVYVNGTGGLGAGIKMLNDFVLKAKPDGLTTFVGSASNLDPTTLRNAATRYDTRKFRMVGGFPAPNGPLILRKDALPRLTDKSQKPVVMGDVNAVRNTDQMAVWGPAYLGWNVRWVVGYKGTNEVVLATIRGEVDMMCTYDLTLMRPAIESGQLMFPVQTGVMKDGKFVSGPGFEGVPVFSDLIRPRLTEEREKKAFASWEVLAEIGKWMTLPPGTPEPIVQAYRDAFDKMVKDKTFIAEASKIFGESFPTASGTEMERVARFAYGISDSDLAFFDELREKVGIHVEQ